VPPADVPQKIVREKGTRMRGADSDIPDTLVLQILSPEHTGRTIQEHPSVFWYVSAPSPAKGVKCKLTITSDDEPEPLVEKFFDPVKDIGIQRIDLKDIPKSLPSDGEFKVSVAIMGAKSGDVMIASSRIKRIAPSEKLLSKLLARPTPAERAIVYAQQGIWYDALAAISDQIAAEPTNKALHAERASLLERVGLKDVAGFDSDLSK
jgi:hypothetical protein